MAHDETTTDQLIAYAMGTLSAEERVRFTERLKQDPNLQAELADLESTVDSIALVGPRSQPSPRLKAQLMEHVTTPPSPQTKTLGWWDRLWQGPWVIRPLWGMVSAAVMVGLLLSTGALWQQFVRLQEEFADLQEQKALLASANSPSSARSASFLVTFDTNPERPQMEGILLASLQPNSSRLFFKSLPSLPENQQFQLWLIRDGKRTSGAVFSGNESGQSWVNIHHEQPMDFFDSVGISIEPYGGSPHPTGPKVMGATL